MVHQSESVSQQHDPHQVCSPSCYGSISSFHACPYIKRPRSGSSRDVAIIAKILPPRPAIVPVSPHSTPQSHKGPQVISCLSIPKHLSISMMYSYLDQSGKCAQAHPLSGSSPAVSSSSDGMQAGGARSEAHLLSAWGNRTSDAQMPNRRGTSLGSGRPSSALC